MDFTPQKNLDYIIILEFTQNQGHPPKVFLSTTDITAGLFKLKVSTKRRKPLFYKGLRLVQQVQHLQSPH